MSSLTFKEFLRMLDEDTDTDIAKLNITKQQLVVRKAQASKPLDDQINTTDKALMMKEKQKAIEDKKKGAQPNGQQQQPSNTTTTPGSTGSQTPGGKSQVSGTARV